MILKTDKTIDWKFRGRYTYEIMGVSEEICSHARLKLIMSYFYMNNRIKGVINEEINK